MREGIIVAVVSRVWVCRHRGAAGKNCASWLLDTRCASSEHFCVTCSRTGLAAVLGWFTMSPKAVRTTKAPRVSRVKFGMATSVEDVGSKDEAAEDAGPQILEMFKQPLRTKCLTPQMPGNEGAQNAAHDRIIHYSTTSTARASLNQDGRAMTLSLGAFRISDSDPLQVSRPVAIPQVVVDEGAVLGGAAGEVGSSHLRQQDALHEVINGGGKASPVVKKTLLTTSREGDDDN
ncbi:hypothetical protein NDU88_001397 [Pleurodeles waltl]|uniref:Uncharacterized protein n=1 Tax=Pleurodeles waltl TaxID=8319 RepID=A0AAV7LBB2_PLEWA|nr:hypothetical protein NDU88_001397 [Pleurodeles waltl]